MNKSHSPLALFLALFLALLLGVAGCAKGPVAPASNAAKRWGIFLAQRDQARQAPGLTASASLNYAGPKNSMRIVLDLWGNADRPLRLDLSTGFGMAVSQWREDDNGWLAYFPSDQAAYSHSDPHSGLRALGLDLPFDLSGLAALVSGTYDGLLPRQFARSETGPEGQIIFHFPAGSPVAQVSLDAAGGPVLLAGRLHGETWEMALSRFNEEAPGVPARTMRLTLSSGVRAVLRVKRLEARQDPWPDKALSLSLPPGTALQPLQLLKPLNL